MASLTVREMRPKDVSRLREIHDKFYKDEFEFPDFTNLFLSGFVILDSKDNILIGGGVKAMAEAIIVTDKDASNIVLGRALIETIRVCRYVCSRYQLQQLHAFVQDEGYGKHLLQHGFEPIKGQSLVLAL